MHYVIVATASHSLIYPLQFKTLATEKALDFCTHVQIYRSILLWQNLHELLKK